MHGSLATPAADLGTIKVAKAEGADGRTVEELWSGKASLKDSRSACAARS